MSALEKQIAAVLNEELETEDCRVGVEDASIERAANKIAALLEPHNTILPAAATLEAETTETLMQMLAATILATLSEEEGGGRANVSYSPLSMDHMMKHYEFTADKEGMVTTVRIKLREDSDLKTVEAWREPSNRHGVMGQDESSSGAKRQAEPKLYDRPVWAIRSTGALWRMGDRADAERQLANYLQGDALATIENRHCVHLDCPSEVCTKVHKEEVSSGG